MVLFLLRQPTILSSAWVISYEYTHTHLIIQKYNVLCWHFRCLQAMPLSSFLRQGYQISQHYTIIFLSETGLPDISTLCLCLPLRDRVTRYLHTMPLSSSQRQGYQISPHYALVFLSETGLPDISTLCPCLPLSDRVTRYVHTMSLSIYRV